MNDTLRGAIQRVRTGDWTLEVLHWSSLPGGYTLPGAETRRGGRRLAQLETIAGKFLVAATAEKENAPTDEKTLDGLVDASWELLYRTVENAGIEVGHETLTRAAEAGYLLATPARELERWTGTDGWRGSDEPGARPEPVAGHAALMLCEFDIQVSDAVAIRAALDEARANGTFKETLYRQDWRHHGYPWYDGLERVTAAAIEIERGGQTSTIACRRTDRDWLDTGFADRIELVLRTLDREDHEGERRLPMRFAFGNANRDYHPEDDPVRLIAHRGRPPERDTLLRRDAGRVLPPRRRPRGRIGRAGRAGRVRQHVGGERNAARSTARAGDCRSMTTTNGTDTSRQETRSERHKGVIAPDAEVDATAWVEEGARVASKAQVGREARIETEARIASGARVDAHVTIGSWANVAAGARVREDARIGPGTRVTAESDIGPESRIGEGASLRIPVRTGRGTQIGDNTRAQSSAEGAAATIGDEASIGRHSIIDECVIEAKACIGEGATVRSGALIKRGASVCDEANRRPQRRRRERRDGRRGRAAGKRSQARPRNHPGGQGTRGRRGHNRRTGADRRSPDRGRRHRRRARAGRGRGAHRRRRDDRRRSADRLRSANRRRRDGGGTGHGSDRTRG